MTMKKSLNEVISNDLWSANKFKKHFIHLIAELESRNIQYDLGRTVMHIKVNHLLYKLYPHYNKRSNEFATLVLNGDEVETYHFKSDVETVCNSILKHIGV